MSQNPRGEPHAPEADSLEVHSPAPDAPVRTGPEPPAPHVAHDSLANELKRTEERLSFVLEAAEVGTWDWNLETGTLDWSNTCLEIFGFPEGSPMTYEMFLNSIHPEDRARVDSAVREALSSRATYDEEMRAVWPDGSVHWVSSKGRAYFDERSRPIRMAGIAQDISNRKEAEQKLRQIEERFSKAFLNSPVAQAMTHLETGRFIDVNDAWQQLTGYSREEVIGRTRNELNIWASKKDSAEFVRVLAAAGWVLHAERLFLKKSGETFLGNISSQLMMVGNNAVALSTIIDMTERNRAQSERERLSEQRQLALDAAHMGWWRYDALTGEATWDERFREIFGVAGLGNSAEDIPAIVHPDDRASVLEKFSKAMDPANPVPYEAQYRLLRPDGTISWVLAYGKTNFAGEGAARHPVEMVGTVQDVTERNRAQEALLRSEKLASLGRMAATIAHEINNPLSAVTNLVYLAEHETGVPSSVLHLLESAQQELRRVAHITSQSLGFFRDSSGPAMVSLASVFESALSLLRNKIDRKRASIRQEWETQVSIPAVANELRQVATNLIGNALDAIGTGGEIRIRARQHGTYCVHIAISDNGAGILPQHRKRLFEPLFSTKSGVGTGLGLWVSRQIIEKHRGTIQVRSCTAGPRRGTTLLIRLPVSAEKDLPLLGS